MILVAYLQLAPTLTLTSCLPCRIVQLSPELLNMAMTQDQFHHLVAKGLRLYAQMNDNIRESGFVFKRLPEIAPLYDTDIETPRVDAISVTLHKGDLPAADQPASGYCDVMVVHPTDRKGDVPYHNYVHEDGRAIICVSNFAKNDPYFETERRMFFSDLLAVSVSRAMNITGGSAKELQSI